MIEADADVVVIGAGFGGSLTALLLQRIGLRSILIDRGRHPRFAIGESSTPLANLVLEALARRYDLPRLIPLANYASWKRAYPMLGVGLKRGFSYFHHRFDEPFVPRRDHANELLVAASHGPDDADTHWLRADFDAFLADEAQTAGVVYVDQTELLDLAEMSRGWQLAGVRNGEPVRLQARFLIDASGEGGFLAKRLPIPDHTLGLRTHSRSVFAHFRNAASWESLYRRNGGWADEHPFPCDQAALHHVFDGGWMWVLPFDNGITSAGFALDPRRFPRDAAVSPEEEWRRLLARLPSVAEQFSHAVPISDAGRLRRTDRLQRRLARAAGPGWALLPSAVAFLDPLHSTGNAHALFGIERLVRLFEESWLRAEFLEGLQRYETVVQQEVDFLDGVVSGSYAGFGDFPKMIAISMFYFATAIWSEHQRRSEGAQRQRRAFLCADDPRLRERLAQCLTWLADPEISAADFTERVRTAIAPFNIAQLCDPARRNLYPYPES
jgi:FADH2 O2-dependent halogenase